MVSASFDGQCLRVSHFKLHPFISNVFTGKGHIALRAIDTFDAARCGGVKNSLAECAGATADIKPVTFDRYIEPA